MKIKFYLFVLTAIYSFTLFADNISPEQAQKVALNFYFEKYNQFERLVSYDQLNIRSVYTETDGNQNFYYVFHINKGGFVIVSADDRLNPVLGYSFTHDFGIENQPPNVKWWVSQYSGQVKYAREKQLVPENSLTGRWAYYLNNDFHLNQSGKESKGVEPLLTTLWDQGWPYNYYCPDTPTGGSGGHTWAGCVATACAQIGYYFRWPDHGQGYTSYIPPSHPEYGVQSADFENTWYRYDEMCDDPLTVNLAIAEYLYHCGVAMHMDYDPGGSVPTFADSLHYFLKFFPFQWIYRDTVPDDEWKAILVSNLDDGFPVYYDGQPASGSGHAFVCDGYQDGDYFHFNLGWGGTSNGYYTIDNIQGFNFNQSIASFICPDTLQFTYPEYCGGADTLTYFEGSICDGSGPLDNYLNNTSASWLINPQTEFDSVTKIVVMVKQIDLYNDDKLSIYDGENNSAPLLAELSGSILPGNIESTGNKVFIEFITDGSNTAPGFYLNYKTSRPVWCSGMTQMTAPTAIFNDGSGPFHYSNSSSCTWMINPGITDPLTLYFNYFDTEENADVLKIYDAGTQTLLAEISGYYEDPPLPVTSTSGKFALAFVTNGMNQRQGWEVWYDIYTGIADNGQEFGLSIMPNPIRGNVDFRFSIFDSRSVSLKIYDIQGREVAVLLDQKLPAGEHVVRWDVAGLPAGIYLYRLQTLDRTVNGKLVKR